MKKISTLYKKDPNDLSRVINEIAPENKWVIDASSLKPFFAIRKGPKKPAAAEGSI